MTREALVTLAIWLGQLCLLAGGASLLQRAPGRAAPPHGVVIAACVLAAVAGFGLTAPTQPFEDFLTAYLPAGRAATGGGDAVAALYVSGIQGFVNLPLLAWLFAPFAPLPDSWASWAFLAGGVAATVLAYRQLCALYLPEARDRFALLLVFAFCGPLLYSMREGNLSHWVLALVTAALVALRHRRDGTGGALLALAVLLKPPLLLLGLYAALAGRWRIVAGGAATLTGVGSASLLLMGVDAHVSWYQQTIAPYSHLVVPAYNVQSIAATVYRATHDASVLLDWEARPLEGLAASVSTMLSLLLLVLAAGSAWWFARRGRERGFEHGLVLMLLGSCLVSPLSWSHYYCFALPTIAILLDGRSRQSTAANLLLSLAVLLVVPLVRPLLIWNETLALLHARLFSAHLLAGGLLLMLCLVLRERRDQGPVSS